MLEINQTALVVIDVQGKIAGLVHDHVRVLENIRRFIRAAGLFGLPVVLTEQVPEKIGRTVDAVRELLPDTLDPICKKTCSCYGAAEFVDKIRGLQKLQILLIGIETHVCVYQTARDLYHHGYEVHLIADAVSSRQVFDHQIAVERMRQEGIIINSMEMAICELFKTTDHPKFREIIAHIKK